ncbi:NSFL1 cofactor p47 [Protobothrops mucrosquamatus]|uniref:NSFL1 cofactor p47 n=1 Tax=Protobothrops mucrosquamatus TaxID=103944 RepID=UPI000775A5FA|nr:NSFL1 cofactor p47 [Protobothrops mucrosquamatus]
MADREEALREFVAVTGAEEERARFFLESAGGDLQIALASFYEDGGDEDIMTLPQPTSSSVTRGTAASDHRVTSFRDLVHAQEEEEEEEEGQRFYAGGSERSGQQIVGPPRKKSSNELVEDLFRGAKEHGAVAVDRTAKSPGEGSRPKPFAGGGYRLGAAPEEESAYVAGEMRPNAAQDVSISGTAPQVMGSSSPSQEAENEAKARSLITIDETEPTTNIQIRLADGGRLVQKFNHSHRIRDIRLFIVDARPAMAATGFVLMTTFPNKELSDEDQTLKDANLLNAVIVQRFV